MISTSRKRDSIETKASTPNLNRIPASIAPASDSGTRFMMRSNQPLKPLTVIRTAEKIKAPIASSRPTPCSEVASSAAPGVDQAVMIGIRCRQERPIVVRPMPMPSAIIHEPT
jgi:hypothetical protein